MTLLKKFKKLNKYTKLAIIIITIGILLRFSLASVYHVSGDGCWHFSVARFIADEGRIPLFEQFGRDEPFWAPPVFHLILAFFYKVFSIFNQDVAEFSMKLVSPLFGSLTLIVSYLIIKELFSKKTALYSLIFLTFIPLSIDYGVFGYVDSTLSFFVALSVYFMLKNRLIGSAICFGLAVLTKYNGGFILPVLLFIIYQKNKKDFLKKTLLFISISALIGLPWFIRNWMSLGSPTWPFFNSILHGLETEYSSSVGGINLLSLFSINGLMALYLGIFGVPDGNYNTLFFIKIPGIEVLFLIWFLATIAFTLPLLWGLFSKKLKHKKVLFIWITSYIVMAMLYITGAGWSISRFLLPAFPALAIIWGVRLNNIKSRKIRKISTLLLILIVAGFVFTSSFKISIAAKSWNFYHDDFEWAKANTKKQDIFLGYQCLSYNLARSSLRPKQENIEKVNYIFVNKKFKLEPQSIVKDGILKVIKQKDLKEIYQNKETGTIIYKTS